MYSQTDADVNSSLLGDTSVENQKVSDRIPMLCDAVPDTANTMQGSAANINNKWPPHQLGPAFCLCCDQL